MTQAKGVKVLFSSLTGDVMLDAPTGALFAMISSRRPGGRAAYRDAGRLQGDLAGKWRCAW